MILDASSLRRQVGKQASAINLLNQKFGLNEVLLRERMGHTRIEILAGVLVGISIGWLAAQI